MSPASDLLDSLPSEASQQLKEHVNQLLLEIIRPNSASQFAQNASILSKFREAVAQGDLKDDIEFLRQFRALVPITSYEHYEPFIAKFFASPCREADVKDMLAPGLPCFLATTSATTGKEPKFFPRYRPPTQYVHRAMTIPSSEGTIFAPFTLKYSKVLKIDCEDSQGSQELAVCAVSSGFMRMRMNWNIEHDMDRLDLWIPGQTAPYAVALIEGNRAFFLLHALFALADSKVTTMSFVFANTFVSVLHYIEDEWLLLVDCIENGIIPDIETTDDLRGALKKHFTAHPARAAELREIGPPGVAEGWAVRVWPALTKFIGITGGIAAVIVPKVTHMLGPSVTIWSHSFGSSECSVAQPYLNGDPAIDFKVTRIAGLIEFVDVLSDEPSEPVLSPWELVKGRHYQPILTTRSGLWRYRLGDVIAVKGFTPDDGMPVINYMHRRAGSSFEVCTESELTSAIISTAKLWIGQIIGFTVVRDERKMPYAFGFLVEIEGEIVTFLGNDAKKAPQQISELLMASSYRYNRHFWSGVVRNSTIRLVEKGTFEEFRASKCDKAGISMAQVKVPVMLSDETSTEWFLSKVIMEL
ncbi:hypothetical protein K503DRAFT_749517 [Rhizopogon vinicolor AM-OR11-026]|uniref:GH3 auxin-responsive promoter n=1 Tax=Rhizopogon vinicolor AM-OR11-026 TaxID=1314800 RepID=A0A1B7MJL4_9AGAM|nr:hypothetical protein K503DRAFT_749517 [Rhizopogon vinicolor AM-OR11-026]